jgi:hypothetical protein
LLVDAAIGHQSAGGAAPAGGVVNPFTSFQGNYFLKARVSLKTLSSLVINLFTQVAIVLELALVSSHPGGMELKYTGWLGLASFGCRLKEHRLFSLSTAVTFV